jgi:hypothetical protein
MHPSTLLSLGMLIIALSVASNTRDLDQSQTRGWCGFTRCFGPSPNRPSKSISKPVAPSMSCIFLKCFDTATQCVKNAGCRQALFCMHKCRSNETCEFKCFFKYSNAQFAAFSKCLFEHKCVPLPGKNAPKCPVEIANKVKPIDLDWFADKKKVYVARGYVFISSTD